MIKARMFQGHFLIRVNNDFYFLLLGGVSWWVCHAGQPVGLLLNGLSVDLI